MADVKQIQQMIPLITCEISLFHLDFGVQINSIKQPIKSNSVSPGNTSHCRASSI